MRVAIQRCQGWAKCYSLRLDLSPPPPLCQENRACAGGRVFRSRVNLTTSGASRRMKDAESNVQPKIRASPTSLLSSAATPLDASYTEVRLERALTPRYSGLGIPQCIYTLHLPLCVQASSSTCSQWTDTCATSRIRSRLGTDGIAPRRCRPPPELIRLVLSRQRPPASIWSAPPSGGL